MLLIDLEKTQELIAQVCDEIKDLLLEKNLKYGNSALTPKRIFSKIETREQICVRIDDKLSRISSFAEISPEEDTVKDLLGYLVLLKVYDRLNAHE